MTANILLLFIFLQGRAAGTTEAATSVVTETVDLEPSTSPPPEKKPFMTQEPSTKHQVCGYNGRGGGERVQGSGLTPLDTDPLSTYSERLFSAAGDIVTSRRSVLSTENVDNLIFLKKN